MKRILPVLLLILSCHAGAISLIDATGAEVTLPSAAQRIVSLAPHATELLFAAGAGEQIVGAVSYSDYPEAALRIPRVGSYQGIDLERLLALKPDLVVGWQSGNTARVLRRLRSLGLSLYISEPRRLSDIAVDIARLGRLAGTETVAERAADALRERFGELAARYAKRPQISVFYQVWHQPLMTVGGEHLISRVIELCGGRNVFAGLDSLSPAVGLEAVVAVDPEAIVASGMDQSRPEWLDIWRAWPQLQAVRRNQLHFVPPDLLQRPTPRLAEGAAQVCAALEAARLEYGR